MSMSPLLIAAPNRAAYFYVNSSAILILISAISLLIHGNPDRLALPLVAILLSGPLFTVGLLIARKRRLNQAAVSREVTNWMGTHFSPYTQGIVFRASDRGDAYATNWKDEGYCIIPKRMMSVLAEPDANPRHKQTFLVTISHELGHLLSRDAQDFTICSILFVSGIVSAAGIWWGLLLGSLHFRPLVFLGLSYLIAMFFYMMYEGVRTREFFADRIAAVIGRFEDVSALLKRKAAEEKHLQYPFYHKLTHPSFLSRNTIFSQFQKIYDYSYRRCFFASFVLALNIGLVPFSANAGAALFGMFGLAAMAVFAVFAMWLNLYLIFSLVVPAALVNRLTFPGLLLRACALIVSLVANLEVLGLTLLNREIYSWGFGLGLFKVDQVIGGLCGIIFLHLSYWVAARGTLYFRGPKRPDRGFYRRLFWAAGIGGLAASAAVIAPVNLLINSFAGSKPDEDDLFVTVLTCFVFIGITFICAAYWRIYLRRRNRSWGSTSRTEVQFVDNEWQADHSIQRVRRLSTFRKVGLYILIFVMGLIVVPSVYGFLGMDGLTSISAWIFAFPIMAIGIWRANSKSEKTAHQLVAT
jgi:hypothetical protein